MKTEGSVVAGEEMTVSCYNVSKNWNECVSWPFHNIKLLSADYNLVVVECLVCLDDPEPDRSKERGQVKSSPVLPQLPHGLKLPGWRPSGDNHIS